MVLGVPAAGGVRTAHLGAGLRPPTQMQWPPRSLHVLTAHPGAGSGGIGSAQPSHLGSRCAVPGSLTSWPKEGGHDCFGDRSWPRCPPHHSRPRGRLPPPSLGLIGHCPRLPPPASRAVGGSGGRRPWGGRGGVGLFPFCLCTAVASLSASVSPGVVTPARGGPGQGGGAPTRLRMKPCCVDTNLG